MNTIQILIQCLLLSDFVHSYVHLHQYSRCIPICITFLHRNSAKSIRNPCDYDKPTNAQRVLMNDIAVTRYLHDTTVRKRKNLKPPRRRRSERNRQGKISSARIQNIRRLCECVYMYKRQVSAAMLGVVCVRVELLPRSVGSRAQ